MLISCKQSHSIWHLSHDKEKNEILITMFDVGKSRIYYQFEGFIIISNLPFVQLNHRDETGHCTRFHLACGTMWYVEQISNRHLRILLLIFYSVEHYSWMNGFYIRAR